jgi:hypothetical protein
MVHARRRIPAQGKTLAAVEYPQSVTLDVDRMTRSELAAGELTESEICKFQFRRSSFFNPRMS